MKKLILILILLVFSASGQATEIYVSDAGNFSQPPWQILKFDENGDNPVVFISGDIVDWPQDILFLEETNTVLISNFGSGRITRHNADTGVYIDNFATSIGAPTRMKIGADNLLYVLQWNGNGKVRRYQLDGTFVDEFTNVGVDQSIGMDWDSVGNLYVSSYNGQYVRKFDTEGRDAGVFISTDLAGPTNIWFDDKGDLLVSDYNGGAVKRFDANGNYQGLFIRGLIKSEGVAMFDNGNILIGHGGSRSVRMYDSDGNYIEDFISGGSGGLITPNAIVIRESVSFEMNAGLNDAWYNPATDGQGFFITVFPELNLVNLAWFTYDTEQPPADSTAKFGDPGHRWITALGSIDGNKADLTITVASGGLFDAATDIKRIDDGSITLSFESCSSGLIEYNIPSINRQGVVHIQRIAGDNIALCEALTSE